MELGKIRTLKEKKLQFPCIASKFTCVIYANGDVALCELTPPIGNIYKQSFDKIWNSDKAKRMRKLIKSGTYNVCKTCTHGCYIPQNMLCTFKGWVRIIGLTD